MINEYVNKIIKILSRTNWKNKCDVREAKKILTDIFIEYTNRIKNN